MPFGLATREKGKARQTGDRSVLSVAAIHQPSEPRGGHNPSAFGSPAASPRLRSAPTRLGLRGLTRSGGGRGRRGKAGPGLPGAGAAPQEQPQRGNAVALSGAGACGAGAGGGCGKTLPRSGLWSEGTEAEVRGAAEWGGRLGKPLRGQWTLMFRPPDLGSPERRRKSREGVKSFVQVAPGTTLGAEIAAAVRRSEGFNTD